MKNNLRNTLSMILVLCFLSVIIPAFAQSNDSQTTQTGVITEKDSSTALRMQPLLDKYHGLTQTDLNAELVKYTDSTTHWGKSYISKISALEIISGYGNGKFGPDDKLLGGQYVLMLIRVMGFRPEVPAGTPYYKPFVDVALQEGILKKGEITDYMKPISRELAASLARRVVGKYETVPSDYFVAGTDLEGKGDKGFFDNVYVGYQKLKMRDFATITNKYAQDAIDCYRMGLITGNNSKFNPKGYLTRVEAAVIIVKLLDKNARVESVPSASESCKFSNELTDSTKEGYCSDVYLYYENKEYTFYKGYFPLMEIYDTISAMNKYTGKINGGAYMLTFNEGNKNFCTGWFGTEQIKQDYKFNNPDSLIISQNMITAITERTKIPKGKQFSIYDNNMGYLYEVSTTDEQNYNTAIKPYVYELMKVWFGDEYQKAKTLHDKYLKLALNDQEAQYDFYMINGRQVKFAGGRDEGGLGFDMQIWAKGVLNEQTMYHKK